MELTFAPTSAFSVRQLRFVPIGAAAPDSLGNAILKTRQTSSDAAAAAAAAIKKSPSGGGCLPPMATAAPSASAGKSGEDEATTQPGLSAAAGAPAAAVRGVTLSHLLETRLLQAGGIVSVSFQGHTLHGVLQADGTIHHSDEVFTTCTAFSTTVKRRIQPSNEPDDGWLSCTYNGRPLADYRTAFLAHLAASSQ